MVEEVPILRCAFQEPSRARGFFRELEESSVNSIPQIPRMNNFVSNGIRENIEEIRTDIFQEPLTDFPREVEPSYLNWSTGYPRFNNCISNGAANDGMIVYERDTLRRTRLALLWTVEPGLPRKCEVEIHMNACVRSQSFKVKRFSWELTEDYICKLYYVRQAFKVVFMKESNPTFIINAGKSIFGSFLNPHKEKLINFEEAYDNLISYIDQPSNSEQIAETLYSFGVKNINFYDVVLRFVLMQVLHDVENIVHMLHREIGDEWVSKPQLCAEMDGFLYYLGELLNIIIPDLLASVRHKSFFYYFKKHISCFILDIFAYENKSYIVIEELAKKIYDNLKKRIEMLISFPKDC